MLQVVNSRRSAWLIVTTFALGWVALLKTKAEIIGYEPFSYRGTATAGAQGGAFWDYENTTWVGHTQKPSDWDPAPGLPGASAWSTGALLTENSGLIRQFCGPDAAGEARGAVSDSSAATRVYLSVLMTRGSGASWGGVSAFEGAQERLFFGLFPDGTGRFAIYDQTTFTRLALSTVDVAVGNTYRLVAKIDYANDLVALYLNPDFSRAEALSTPVLTAPYPASHATTALRLASGPGGLTQWDDLTVATTWTSLHTYHVTNTNDSGTGSFRAAVAVAAAAGARVTFAALDEQYEITLTSGEIALAGSTGLVIEGPEHSGVTIRPETGLCFRVGSAMAVAVSNLTFAGGDARVYPDHGASGGAVTIEAGGSFSADRCSFRDNRSGSLGGAIMSSGLLRLHRCTFYNNEASFGGAVFVDGLAGIAELIHCTFTGNTGDGALGVTGGTARLHATVLEKTRNGPSTRDLYRGPTLLSSLAAEACVIANADGSSLTATATNRNVLGTAAAPVDARLAPPGYYNGLTDTTPPLPGSPVIDLARTGATHGGDARYFAIVSFPDAGATEFRGRADLALYWKTDWDGDGEVYGSEQGAGRDPRRPDTHNGTDFQISRNLNGEPRISFTRLHPGLLASPPALSWTRWQLKRFDPMSGLDSWETIYTFDGTTLTDSTAPGVTAINSGDGLADTMTVHVTDLLPNPAQILYRLETELIP